MCVLAEPIISEASRPSTDPVCAQCHEAFDRRDSGWLFAGLCSVCESNRLEGMIIAVVYAPDRKAVNIALKAIKRLRNLVK